MTPAFFQKATLIQLIFVLFLLVYVVVKIDTHKEPISEIDTYEDCNVLSLNLRGYIDSYLDKDGYSDFGEVEKDVTSADDLRNDLDGIEDSSDIKAILVLVDSYGGSPYAGSEIAETFKHTNKPVVAVIREAGVSAAYHAISGANRIFASKNSYVGGIGITSSYIDNTEKNQKEGLRYIEINSGKYKDMLDPDKPLTFDELTKAKEEIKTLFEIFIEKVSKDRKIPLEKVRKLADGSGVFGEEAKALGLIDEIGGYYEAKSYLEGVIKEEVRICSSN